MVVLSGGKKAAVVRGTPGTFHAGVTATEDFPFVEIPINSGPLRARVPGVRQGELVGHDRIP